jgi:purine-cytosine permease-like protein
MRAVASFPKNEGKSMSYLELNLKTRSDWENYFPKVSRARAIRAFVGATLLVGVVMLLGLFLAGVLSEHQGQPTVGTLGYVFFPTIVIAVAILRARQTASAFSHAPPAMRGDRDALATVLWTTARLMVKFAVVIGIMFLIILLTLSRPL